MAKLDSLRASLVLPFLVADVQYRLDTANLVLFALTSAVRRCFSSGLTFPAPVLALAVCRCSVPAPLRDLLDSAASTPTRGRQRTGLSGLDLAQCLYGLRFQDDGGGRWLLASGQDGIGMQITAYLQVSADL